jgi:signal transduction histidine kinase
MNLLRLFLKEGFSLSESLDVLDVGIIIANNSGHIIFRNKAIESIFKHYSSLNSLPPLVMALQGGEFRDQSFHLNLDSNTAIDVSCSGKPLKRNKEIVGAIITCKDLKSSFLREKEMAQERAFYGQLVDYIPAVIYSRSLSGEFIFTNKSFQELHLQKVTSGKSLIDLIESEEKKLTHDSKTDFAVALPLEGDKELYYEACRFPIFDEAGHLFATGSIAWDVTAKIEQERLIEEERQRGVTASKLAAIGHLSAEIGHEINNPLSIIKTSAKIVSHLLKEDTISKDDIQRNIDVITDTVNRITKIVSALKTVSREGLADHLEQNCVNEILNEVFVLSEATVKYKGIDLIKEFFSNSLLSMNVLCHRVQLAEVFMNIISNSCDAVEGKEKPWIKIRLDEDIEYLYFKISDSGPGVSEENKEKIFHTFFSTKDVGKGTGLGLSVSKSIMEKHGGDLYLDQESNNCFVVKLPKLKVTT